MTQPSKRPMRMLAGLLLAATMLAAHAAPAWQEGNTYTAGTVVTYNGRDYQATVTHTAYVGANWNPASTPTLWQDLGPNNATPTPYVTVTPITPPPTPCPTCNDTPRPSLTPVTPVVTPPITPVTPVTGGCKAAWVSGNVYTGGNQVSYAGVNYEAKWWTQGDNPSQSGDWGVWKSLGNCGGVSPTPTATPTPTSTPTPTGVTQIPQQLPAGTPVSMTTTFSETTARTVSVSWRVDASALGFTPARWYVLAGYTNSHPALESTSIYVADDFVNNRAAYGGFGAINNLQNGTYSYYVKVCSADFSKCGNGPVQNVTVTGTVTPTPTVSPTPTTTPCPIPTGIPGATAERIGDCKWRWNPVGRNVEFEQAQVAIDGVMAEGVGRFVTNWRLNGATFAGGSSNVPSTWRLFFNDGYALGDAITADGASYVSSKVTGNWAPSFVIQVCAAGYSNCVVSSPITPVTLPVTPTPTPTPVTGDGLPKHALIGYWHNFTNPSGPTIRIRDVSDDWDVIMLSFGEDGGNGAVTFTLDPNGGTEAEFIADIAAKRAKGKKVVLSLGGQEGRMTLNTRENVTNFVNSLHGIINKYGLDGIDLDLESGAGVVLGTPIINNLITAMKELKAKVGPTFYLSMAPEHPYVQGGYVAYSGIWGAYLPIIDGLRDDLNMIHVQYYNNGGLYSPYANGALNEGTVDALVGGSLMLIEGFKTVGGTGWEFKGLRPDQVAFGVPSGSRSANTGFVTSATVSSALNCLTKLQNCGTVKPKQAYPTYRGVMTWSINWDRTDGFNFSKPTKAALNALP
ncbi:carbohydrate-binding protein [Chitinolyticbacter meiyuanensis]|uniref:carbohydrate-binding protein n=1 Tax=Chitinolyticbacter meiyuanensis TaxID=682798 RepID=UPI0027E3DE68|nr:carbohydrate-binding protein [Chitinolyticbacter meiyuanensis]